MKIKRFQLDVEFEASRLHVFHTMESNTGDDPPTLINVNGQDFEGEVSFIQIGDDYNIRITRV